MTHFDFGHGQKSKISDIKYFPSENIKKSRFKYPNSPCTRYYNLLSPSGLGYQTPTLRRNLTNELL